MIDVVEEEEKLLVQLHCESTRKGQHLLSLRASEIVDFSSQYGTEDSLSYTAENLLGPPAIYPRAGDHAYSCQLVRCSNSYLYFHISHSVLTNFRTMYYE